MKTNLIGLLMLLLIVGPVLADPGRAVAAEPEPLALTDYPRPPSDTGMGLHWFPVSGGWTREQVDFYVGEMRQMGISWVKLLAGAGPQPEVDYLVTKLVENEMMPIIRLAGRSDENNGDMSSFVHHYVSLGARYFEFFNEPAVDEPNTPLSAVMDRWMARARETQRAGGIPILTSLFPSADLNDNRSYDAALRYLKEQGAEGIFRKGAGIAVHNYTLNHPLAYPDDPVQQMGQPLSSTEAARFGIDEDRREEMNRRRAADKRPGTTVDQDPWGFRMFETMENRFVRTFGFPVPVIGTEGGATVGEVDPRYPKVDEALQAEMTIKIAEYMQTKAPAYYFVSMNWLIGNAVMGQPALPTWEDQAWYRTDRQMPVVAELKNWMAEHAPANPRPAPGSSEIVPAADGQSSQPAAQTPMQGLPFQQNQEGSVAPVPLVLASYDGKGVITLINVGGAAAWVVWREASLLLRPGAVGQLDLFTGELALISS
jgi:hypothetical protein